MKLSSRTKYGIKALYYLSLEDNTRPVPLTKISKKCDISLPYLEKILAKLRTDGIVKSVRGATGGYSINRPLSEITFVDMIKSLEGSILNIDCVSPDCNQDCPNRQIFGILYEKVYTLLSDITLLDLVNSLDNEEKII